MADKIDFSRLFDGSDSGPIDAIIGKVEKLIGLEKELLSAAEKTAAAYVGSLNDIQDAAGKLESEIDSLDATQKEHNELILKAASDAEKLIKAQEDTAKAAEEEKKVIESLIKRIQELESARDKLNNKVIKEKGSIAALRQEYSEAVKAAENMGEATDQVVKDAAIKKVGELSKQVTSAEAALKQAKKGADALGGSYNKLEQEVNEAKKQLKAMEGGIGSNSKKFKDLQKTVADGTAKLKTFDSAVGDNRRSVGDYGLAIDKLDEASGGAVSGVKKLADGFKLLFSNPWGAIILAVAAALGSLMAYFKGSVEGQDNFNKVLAIGNAILQTLLDVAENVGKVLFDAISKPKKLWQDFLDLIQPLSDALTSAWEHPLDALKAFGQAIVDNVISRFKAIGVAFEAIDKILQGDFAEGFKGLADAAIQGVTGITNATDKIVDAVTGVYDVLSEEAKKLAAEMQKRADLGLKIAALENQIRKDKIADVIDDAKTELDVYKKLNEAQDKLRFSANERYAAQKAAGKLLEDQLAGDLELIGKEIAAQKLIIQQDGDTYEAREKLAGLVAQQIGLESSFEKAFKKRQATERQLLEEAEKDRLAIIKREADAQRALSDVITKSHIEANKEIIADERVALSDRLRLIEDNAGYAEELAKSNLDKELAVAHEAGLERVVISADILDKIYSQEGASAEQINALRRQAAEEALATDTAYLNDVARLNGEYLQAVEQVNQDAIDATAQNVFTQWERDYNKLLDTVGETEATDLLNLGDQLANGEISFKDFLKSKQDIQDQAQLDSLNSQLAYLEKLAADAAKHGYDTTELDRKVAETKLALQDDENAKLIEGQALLQTKLKELQQVGIDTALSIVDSFNQKGDEERAARLEALDTQYQNELTLAGDNDAAKLELQNAYNVEKAKIDKEQKTADRKRAVFQKTLALVEIAINTAKGIGLALGTYPPPVSFALAAVTAVLGALQVAAVLAKPIPAFAEGTDYAPRGFALVGEEGPEAVKGRNGTRIVGAGGPEIVHLDRGDRVYTAEETAAMYEESKRGDRLVAGFDDDTQKMRHIKADFDAETMTRVLGSKLDRLVAAAERPAPAPPSPFGIGREVARGINLAAFEAHEYR